MILEIIEKRQPKTNGGLPMTIRQASKTLPPNIFPSTGIVPQLVMGPTRSGTMGMLAVEQVHMVNAKASPNGHPDPLVTYPRTLC